MRTTGKARARVPLATVEPGPRLGYRLGELARLTGIAASTLSDLIRRGELGAVRIGERGVLVPAESWRSFCAAHAVAPARKP